MIEVSHLSKKYGTHPAIEDLSFTVGDGQIFGLLGPNGAGKSTIMNILTGYLAPTSGEVKVAGFSLPEQAQQAKACVGYLPEQPPLYPEMTVQEYLDFAAELKGIKKKADRKEQVRKAARRTGLEEVLPRLIRSLSKGYRQRVGIAAALLGTPKVIILDEPTVGLDPAQMIEIRSLIRDLGKTHTVILSSHILSEVQSVCDRVLIIAHGKLVAQGTPEELAAQLTAKGTITATAQGSRDAVVGRCIRCARPDRCKSHRRKGRRGQLYRRQHCGNRPARCTQPGAGPGGLPGAESERRNHEPGGCVPAADRSPGRGRGDAPRTRDANRGKGGKRR